MKKGVFISYANLDKNKKDSLKRRLNKSEFLFPVVITDQRQSMKNLGDKIIAGFNVADFLIPILTKNSIDNQWVNQEIGFARSLEIENKIKIIPIVEESILTEKLLKGFIHDQLDLPYQFKSFLDPKKERNYFRKSSNILIKDLEFELARNNHKIIKFKGSRKLYLPFDNKLRQFPDRNTRELFGYRNEDIMVSEDSEKFAFSFGEKIPSIKKVDIVLYNRKYYAKFENELKEFPSTWKYYQIKEINSKKPIHIVKLEKDMTISESLIDIDQITF